MIDLALHYARNRWPVFPLTDGGKVPREGSHGHKDATLDLARIASWWRDWPEANIGIATGRRAALLVIDVDVKDSRYGLESLRTLNLPHTFTVKTATGGFHLYFDYGGRDISIGSDLLPGIDWRCNGGYVVAAGSIVGAIAYTIARNVPIVPAPVHLLTRLRAAKARPKIVATDAGGRMIIPSGARNSQLHRIACMLRRYGVGSEAMLEAMRAINRAHCRPELDGEELEQLVHSALQYAPSETPREAS